MLKGHAIFGTLGICALTTPAYALSWDFCEDQPCAEQLPNGLKLAIGIGCLGKRRDFISLLRANLDKALLLLLLISLAVCAVRRRRAVQDKEYDVEESQMSGPPTIIGTQYDPTSGASGIYSGGFPQQMSAPTYPVSAYRPKDTSYTAPHSQTAFNTEQPYAPAYSPRAPKTAFVSGGFASPRPQLAGDRLKERLKERPASETSIASASPVDRRRR